MSTRTSNPRLKRFVAGLGAGTVVVLILALANPAHAQRRRQREDFSVTLPVVAPVTPPSNGSIFQPQDGYAALYEGQRARRVGDPLTIVLVERTSASNSSSTELESSGGFSITPPSSGPLSFDPGAARLSGSRNFSGTGSTGQNNALSGEISVTIAAVYPNGTMLVQGQKRVRLNRGDEMIQIRGIVRMADVDASNRVASTRVADASIAYTGRGDVARASRQGWLSRFFSVISPF